MELRLREGDRHFLPPFSDEFPRRIHGVMPHRDWRMLSWKFNRRARVTASGA